MKFQIRNAIRTVSIVSFLGTNASFHFCDVSYIRTSSIMGLPDIL